MTTVRRPKLFTSVAIRALLAGDPLCSHCGGAGRVESHKRRDPCPSCGGDGVPATTAAAWRAIDFRMGLELGWDEWKAARSAR